MNRAFFQAIRHRIDLVNACAYRVLKNNFERPFSEIFANLFGEINENMWSWLDAISSSFHFECRDEEVNQSVIQIFQDLNIDPETHIHDFQFWAYLVTMYRVLGSNQYSRNDNIFEFMKDFRITETRVVIIGQDPPPNSPTSSGYAFHPCENSNYTSPSYLCLIEYLEEHYNLLSRFHKKKRRIAKIKKLAEQENIKGANSLQGWIQQKVLLINMWLTHNKPEWDTFTNFIWRYINDNVNHVVFIIMGLQARNACDNDNVINRENHLGLELVHPIFYDYRNNERNLESLGENDWKRILPFINANLFLSHHSRGTIVIDWKSVTSLVPANNNLEEMERFVTSLRHIADTAEEDEHGQVLKFRIPVKTRNPEEGSIIMRWVGTQPNGRYLQLELRHPHEQ